jgi:hypothetical protein
MSGLLLALFACAPDAPPPVAPAPPQAVAPPAGAIGGEPILPRPTVVGAISADDVVAGMASQEAAIHRCWEQEKAKNPALAGKVLVKFVIGTDGAVRDPTVRSSSLRDPATEACVVARVGEVRYPPLASGTAVVHYPFVFP